MNNDLVKCLKQFCNSKHFACIRVEAAVKDLGWTKDEFKAELKKMEEIGFEMIYREDKESDGLYDMVEYII